MRILPILVTGLVMAGCAMPLQLQARERVSEVYKTIGDIQLSIHVFRPEGWSSEDKRPAVLFFHGGGWGWGDPSQFSAQAEYFARRGMVALSAQYRLMSKHGTTPIESTRDAMSAMRWVRAHASELGIDPDRIAAGGGSAGGHLAATLAIIENVRDAEDDVSVSARPDALILFNPALNLDIAEVREERGEAVAKALLTISPHHHLKAGLPPTIIFHGTADALVAFSSAEAFVQKAKEFGADITLVPYEGRPHSFFNSGRGDGSDFRSTLKEADAFLIRLGWLKPAAAAAE